jgi:hypothetical protein
MALLGTLSSVNLIAGAGILGNIGGVALLANANLVTNISSYTGVGVVNQFTTVAGTGYVSINVVANTFPALTNAIPTAYQSNLGSGTLTSVITNQSNQILGSGDLGIFDQVFSSAYGYVQQTNQLIKSVVNANSEAYAIGWVNQDNLITGALSSWTLSFSALSLDLSRLGELINFEDLGNLGSPNALLKQIYSLSASTPALNDALLLEGISQSSIDDIEITALSAREQKLAYQAMTKITGTGLQQILDLLKVTTPGLTTMADLLNPIKIFPTSYITFTTTTNNGLRGVYLDTTGTINTNLEFELPSSVISPLQGAPTTSTTTYEELKRIIPADQALANKAIQVALEQVKTIFNTNLSSLTVATSGLETDQGLNLINSLTAPLPANVVTYFTTNFNNGSGPDGTLLLTDVIGTPTGWVHNTNLSNTTAVLGAMTTSGAFSNLTNSSNGVYTVMANTASGIYTTQTGFAPPDDVWTTTIPVGLPGSGSYTGSTAGESISSAFSSGLTPNMIANVNQIVSSYSSEVAQCNNNWANICVQIIDEDINMDLAGLDFGNLVANLQPLSLVTNLSQYGLDVIEGGAAYVFESLANISSQGGQAVVSTMREARNQERLNNAGIETNIIVSDVIEEPVASLSNAEYTVNQAVAQKII